MPAEELFDIPDQAGVALNCQRKTDVFMARETWCMPLRLSRRLPGRATASVGYALVVVIAMLAAFMVVMIITTVIITMIVLVLVIIAAIVIVIIIVVMC